MDFTNLKLTLKGSNLPFTKELVGANAVVCMVDTVGTSSARNAIYSLVQVLAVPISIQFSAHVTGKVVDDGANA